MWGRRLARPGLRRFLKVDFRAPFQRKFRLHSAQNDSFSCLQAACSQGCQMKECLLKAGSLKNCSTPERPLKEPHRAALRPRLHYRVASNPLAAWLVAELAA